MPFKFSVVLPLLSSTVSSLPRSIGGDAAVSCPSKVRLKGGISKNRIDIHDWLHAQWLLLGLFEVPRCAGMTLPLLKMISLTMVVVLRPLRYRSSGTSGPRLLFCDVVDDSLTDFL